jgi:hypothetical protein
MGDTTVYRIKEPSKKIMNHNRNSTRVTITPPNMTGFVSATRQSANKPDTGKGLDPKAAKKHHLKIPPDF